MIVRFLPAVGLVLILAAAPAGFNRTVSQTPPPDYCAIDTAGTKVEVIRPDASELQIDDVNWFARPVPNPGGHWVIGFASHNLNYLYDLTTGARIRIPDRSDAVATPDGRYMTVPSTYTATRTVNFYDLPVLLAHLDRNEDAADVPPVFAHHDDDMTDVYYQSVGIVSERREGATETIVYRMMFSGSRHPEPPGFRIVDYEFRRTNGRTEVTPGPPMRLCARIVEDMATPFISKDGRYVAAHDDSHPDRPASLKIFEITAVDPDARTTTCEERVDFGFAAGKADFSFDGSKLTFHISKHDYLTAFINGGIRTPAITDIVIVDLERDADGAIKGYGPMARVTTSSVEGVGSYFPAFLPDGRLFYISNEIPRDREGGRRFRFTVVDPAAEIRMANLFADPVSRERASAIGELWRDTCAPEMQPFQQGEAAWWFMSLTPDRCRRLVEARWTPARAAASGTTLDSTALLEACARS